MPEIPVLECFIVGWSLLLPFTFCIMPKHIIIVGAGVMGACTSFFLSREAATHDMRVTVIEKTGVACGASGKAGGFLARDWGEDELSALSSKSFDLHAKLAEELNGEANYGYRRVDTYSVSFNNTKNSKTATDISWLNQNNVRSSAVLGTPSTTAQVHPRQFTQTLLDEATETGHVKILQRSVTSLLYDAENKHKVVGVVMDGGETLRADAVVICMGPWSGRLELINDRGRKQLLPIDGTRAHSIVINPGCEIPAQALFTLIIDRNKTSEPEDGTVYVCGATDNEPLPESAEKVEVKSDAVKDLEHMAAKVSSLLSNRQIIAKQACYLPTSKDGLPLIGAHPSYAQLYIATGHSCWGILNSPITGLMVSELLTNSQITCLDKYTVEAVDPKNRL
ncbi:hypothetical protein DFQ28_004298 [Apophysomyces sp. BC1034]|nr:hypothetical protein DFQ30_003881 [Apophysomyces sp. BC1015]KAG0178797.1 hypothetical protein DFQ29_003009 [Apophysomyces sp. BC1021]KAG0188832.1 hypothetical protein DFQ28_004298 [Apophysomyces sp. BC1034]